MSYKIAVEVKNLSKNFLLANNQPLSILKNISMKAEYGEFISILGVSGSGKSTLLKCMSSLLVPSYGSVEINSVNPYKLRNNKLAKLRREDISFIFQSYNLVPALPVVENILLPFRLSHKRIQIEKIEKLLEQMNFNADIHSFVGTLSGGEKQKVTIARAILTDSNIIFADEPTGALDSSSRQIIFDLLRDLANQGKCIVMVTHDIELASYTDRALILKDGEINTEFYKPSAEDLYVALETNLNQKL
ncbi:ABC transporter ATP-binding protein [Streptococcus sp. FT1-106]|uniref:ABC transporter ATP-binding protein n=1 Tax=unclassified Streptococcus TaxID=2608887 RepID=UPI003BF54523